MLKIVPELNVAHQLSHDSTLTYPRLSSYSDKSSLLAYQTDYLIHVPTSRNIVLDSAKHVPVVARVWIQIVKSLYLVTMLEIMLAFLRRMVFEDNKFLALMLCKFAFQSQLLFCEVK
jgi:hypothetical protein